MKYDSIDNRITHVHAWSIRPNYATRYVLNVRNCEAKRNETNETKQAKRNETTKTAPPIFSRPITELSSKAKKRIGNAISWLTYLAEPVQRENPKTKKKFTHTIAFITLTLPTRQSHNDRTIKSELLHPFLRYMRKYHQLENYIWKAELQDNGNIHFHITTDTYINAYILRAAWNRQLKKLGYIEEYRNRFKAMSFQDYMRVRGVDSTESKLRAWKAYNEGNKTNWSNPNTTDIHKVHNISNLSAYMKKYMLKGVKKEGDETAEEKSCTLFYGKIWGCSQSISKLKGVQDTEQSEIEDILGELIATDEPYVIENDYYEVYCINAGKVDNKKFMGYHMALLNYAYSTGYKSYASMSPP